MKVIITPVIIKPNIIIVARIGETPRMSIAIGHFAAGAGIILLGYQIVRPEIRRKAPNKWLMAILAGLWAMFPDLSQFVKRLEGFHDSLWGHIGFFHQIMDRLDADDSDVPPKNCTSYNVSKIGQNGGFRW